MSRGFRILLSIPNTLSTRNILRTDVLRTLRAEAERIVVVAPFAGEAAFREEFVDGNVVATAMTPYRPGRQERVLRSAIYNLYLSGTTPSTMQWLLDLWADQHPVLGPVRRGVVRRVLPALRPLVPRLEARYARAGEVGGYPPLIARERFDVAVFTRLFFCDEIPLMRAALRAGVPTVGLVASWDNLTSKGLLLPRLDRLVVWNDLLRDEAVRYHGYRPEQIVVAGAPHHDLVFGGAPRASREEFFAQMGLDPTRRLITYAGEDPVIAPEAPFYVDDIQRFIAEDRLAEPCQLLVRPHPQDDPRRFDHLRGRAGVVVDLPGRPAPGAWMDMRREDLQRLYETLEHSAVVVNVASTIVLDAAMVDTPSICIGYTLERRRRLAAQERLFEMDHFQHVTAAGCTTVARSEQELQDALNAYLRHPELHAAGRRRVVDAIAQFRDGRSGQRTAEAIMAAARRTAPPRTAAAARSTVETATHGAAR